jgi:hypothetical protein
MVWYITVGRDLAEAEELRALMGEWDSEWSLRHIALSEKSQQSRSQEGSGIGAKRLSCHDSGT